MEDQAHEITLVEFVRQMVVRGRCRCGRCLFDESAPEQIPGDHSVDMVFFDVGRARAEKGGGA